MWAMAVKEAQTMADGTSPGYLSERKAKELFMIPFGLRNLFSIREDDAIQRSGLSYIQIADMTPAELEDFVDSGAVSDKFLLGC